MPRVTNLDMSRLNRGTIGFERVFDALFTEAGHRHEHNYPPYNIVQLDDNDYMISIAVAGFSMEYLNIVKDKNVLRVEGNPADEGDVRYLHKGIGGRRFRREFTLADYVEVESAELELGMLNIRLKRIVPADLLPKTIEITSQ